MLISNPNQAKPVALIAGPTASGKTALALSLAARHNVTIINADSAQVYANLPILSAQPSAAEMASAPHRLFGYLDGKEACSTARWAADAKEAIAEAHLDDRLPVLVGGTGLYMRTLLDGIAPVPDIDPGVRAAVRALPTQSAAAALADEDAALAAKLAPNDDSRIKRGLEVIRSTGRSILDWRKEKIGGILGQIDLHPLILLPPRDWLHNRCDTRFQMMMNNGAVEEVKALLAMELPLDAPVMRAIGVPDIAAMLADDIGENTAIERGQAATRQYAKRQYTWFRNQSPVDWPRFEEIVCDSNMDKIERLFQF
jgi:tRNA dimethylallyltransferase